MIFTDFRGNLFGLFVLEIEDIGDDNLDFIRH